MTEKEKADLIVEVVGKVFDTSPADIISKKRDREYVLPRHLAMNILRNVTDGSMSLKRIGNYFGRDHSTVMHGIQACQTTLEINAKVKRKYKHVESILNSRSPGFCAPKYISICKVCGSNETSEIDITVEEPVDVGKRLAIVLAIARVKQDFPAWDLEGYEFKKPEGTSTERSKQSNFNRYYLPYLIKINKEIKKKK